MPVHRFLHVLLCYIIVVVFASSAPGKGLSKFNLACDAMVNEMPELKLTVKNIPGGNPLIPGSSGVVFLESAENSFMKNTSDGKVVFDRVPASVYNLRVEVPSASNAFGNQTEYWGTIYNLEIDSGLTELDFQRKMPYVAGVNAVEANGFSGLSAHEAGIPVSISLLISNPGKIMADVEVMLKLKNFESDSIFLLKQQVEINAGHSRMIEFVFTPDLPGQYYYAPALRLAGVGKLFTDCWDWGHEPLFSVSRQHRFIDFSGFSWLVKSGFAHPGPNMWSDHKEHVGVNENGELILTITPAEPRWMCTEIVSTDFFGYGTFIFNIIAHPVKYKPHMVAAMFLYHDEENEIDIEFTRWGDPLNENVGNYVVQPHAVPGNEFAFPMDLSGTHTSHSIRWEPSKVVFTSWHGHHPEPSPHNIIAQWEYSGENIPLDFQMRLHLSFWLFRGFQPENPRQHKFVVSRMHYSPL